MIKKLTERMLDGCMGNGHFRNYINSRATLKNGLKVVYSNQNPTFDYIFKEFDWHDIRHSDVVLDIGACVGAYAMHISNLVEHVYAVEPIMQYKLIENIELNNIKNITLINGALGEGEPELEWGGVTKKIKCLSLSEIIKLCGGHIDVLKCNCEGGEWYIRPWEFEGIRRIEICTHDIWGRNEKYLEKIKELKNTLTDSGFRVNDDIHTIHGFYE